MRTTEQIKERISAAATRAEALGNQAPGCEYCREARKPLFRVVDGYTYGDAIDLFEECEYLDATISEDSPHSACADCEKRPFYMVNNINITVAVAGKRMMFEDKTKGREQRGRRWVDINFCPICGRKLHEKEGQDGHI